MFGVPSVGQRLPPLFTSLLESGLMLHSVFLFFRLFVFVHGLPVRCNTPLAFPSQSNGGIGLDLESTHTALDACHTIPRDTCPPNPRLGDRLKSSREVACPK